MVSEGLPQKSEIQLQNIIGSGSNDELKKLEEQLQAILGSGNAEEIKKLQEQLLAILSSGNNEEIKELQALLQAMLGSVKANKINKLHTQLLDIANAKNTEDLKRLQAQLRAIDSSIKQGHSTGRYKSIIAAGIGKEQSESISQEETQNAEQNTLIEPKGKEKGALGKGRELAEKLFKVEASSKGAEKQEGAGKVKVQGIFATLEDMSQQKKAETGGIKVQGIIATLEDTDNKEKNNDQEKDKPKTIKELSQSVMDEVHAIMGKVTKPFSQEEINQSSALGQAKGQAAKNRENIPGRDPTNPEE